eukprot:TRINITY_DN18494_c0_g1_i1.p1 TRINITY_DN18494_c0_g1~~TRINITY_DN18494_c0_g1_i1.p1  ORF type:complete len:542 (+),score=174.02 TRINITY_DN18494_c0_g1_i1:279-1904(+)
MVTASSSQSVLRSWQVGSSSLHSSKANAPRVSKICCILKKANASQPLSFQNPTGRGHSLANRSHCALRRESFNVRCSNAAEAVAAKQHPAKKHHDKRHEHHKATEDVGIIEWLKENGAEQPKVVLKDKKVHGHDERPIHVLVAAEDLKAGQKALSIPDNLVVTLERVLGDENVAELLTTNKLSELACLALYLMYEKKRGRESFWFPFIRELDRQRGRGQAAVESPLLWSKEEIDGYLQGSPMKQIVKERLIGIEREFNELDTVWFMAGSLFQEYPFDIPTEAFTFQIFKQAFAAVQASVVHLQGVNLAKRFALVPLGPPLTSYKSNCRAMLKANAGHVELEVDRDYEQGEPIVAWCGPQPNVKLFLNYGFVDEDNPYDRLTVEAALDTKDPLYQQKKAIVQKNEKMRVQAFQIYRNKEMAAVYEMLPYVRLAHVVEEEALEDVIFAKGPICPVSPCNERAVLNQIREYTIERMSGYATTIEEDNKVIGDDKAPPKKRVASKLLKLEKKILRNFLAAVDELINELPDGSDIPCQGVFPPIFK